MCNMLRRHIARRLYSADFIPSQDTSFQGQNKVCRVVPHIGQALKEQGAFSAHQPVANKRAVKCSWETSREKKTKSSGNGGILLPVWFLAEGCLLHGILGFFSSQHWGPHYKEQLLLLPQFCAQILYWPRPLSAQLLLLCYILRRVTALCWIKSSKNLSRAETKEEELFPL